MVRRKRARFTEIELQIIEKSLAINMSPAEIAASLGRNVDSVKSKIWSMGWKPLKKQMLRQLTEIEKQQIKDRKRALTISEINEGKQLRQSLHPYLGSDWQEILVSTGSKIGEFRGQRILLMHGRPTTTQEILAQYKLLMEQLAAQCIEEAAAAEKSCQAKH